MRAFKVGDKVTSEAFGDGVVVHDYDADGYPLLVKFENGELSYFAKDGLYWSDNSVPHKNIKHKEAQGMNKSDLKTGMVVEYRDGSLRVVLADVGLLVGRGWSELEDFKSDLRDIGCTEMDIMKIYSVPCRNADYINISLEHRELIWQREEVKEMTVDEISKALGYTVKVVGGE